MKERLLLPTVSKPDGLCIGCEQGCTNWWSNLLVITWLVFWHYVIGITVQDQIKKLYSG